MKATDLVKLIIGDQPDFEIIDPDEDWSGVSALRHGLDINCEVSEHGDYFEIIAHTYRNAGGDKISYYYRNLHKMVKAIGYPEAEYRNLTLYQISLADPDLIAKSRDIIDKMTKWAKENPDEQK